MEIERCNEKGIRMMQRRDNIKLTKYRQLKYYSNNENRKKKGKRMKI